MKNKITPVDKEILMQDDDLIVSKTDTQGRITYCNRNFIKISGYSETELLGKQHNIVRHPDMPRTVFSLLWETIKNEQEFFGYVKNMTKEGYYYWVFAHVTPSYKASSFKSNEELIGYFSIRRKPSQDKLKAVQNIYREILAKEQQSGSQLAMIEGRKTLDDIIHQTSRSYREFILSL